MTEQKIYLKPADRSLFLGRHEFFVEYVKSHVFGDFFDKIDKETNSIAECFYAIIHDGNEDRYAHGIIKDYREMLSWIKVHITFAILTSLYHQWEKDVRKCAGYNLESGYDSASSIEELLDKFKQSGWDVRKEPWFQMINSCRAIVNVYKHNDEVDRNNLHEKYPQFFNKELIQTLGEWGELYWGYEELSIRPEGFDEIANAFRQFWVNFPGEPL